MWNPVTRLGSKFEQQSRRMCYSKRVLFFFGFFWKRQKNILKLGSLFDVLDSSPSATNSQTKG